MPKRLVITVAYGPAHDTIFNATHWTREAYAERHRADMLVVRSDMRMWPEAHPSYEDFRIPQLLGEYDEIVHLDNDLIVANDTPWLLSQSQGMMCAVDESRLDSRSRQQASFALSTGKVVLPPPWPNGRYFNLGVFGVTKKDAEIFADPELFYNSDQMGHQSHINYRLSALRWPVRDLGVEFNSMVFVWDNPTLHHTAYIIHYAGQRVLARVLDMIDSDVRKFKSVHRL